MNPKIVGRCTGRRDIRHEGCGGQIMTDGTFERLLPVGFGFRGNEFVVDKVSQTGYLGFCLKCHKEGAFISANVKPKLITTKPKGINNRIKLAQTKWSVK